MGALAVECTWERVDHAGVFVLALDTGLSGYDASYLWLARDLDVPLLTFDRRLTEAAVHVGLS